MDFDFDALFEPWDRYRTYEFLDAELQAIAAGSKAMSYFHIPDEEIGTTELYADIQRIASELGLLTFLRKSLAPEWEGPFPHTYVFVIRGTEEAWRIPAFLLTTKAGLDFGWDDSIDRVMAYLLGYSDAEIRLWYADLERYHVIFGESTLLFLMTSAQAANIRMLGGRAIDPKAIGPPITVFCNRQEKIIRKDASTLLPPDHELARAAVDRALLRIVFPVGVLEDTETEIATCQISEAEGTALNSALRSRFYFMGPEGWL